MFAASTVGARLGALAGSAVLHAAFAVAVVAAGHGSARRAPVTVAAVSEIVAPEFDPRFALPVDVPAPEPAAEARPTHTHPYPVAKSHDATPHDPSIVHTPLAPTAPSTPEPASAPEVETAPATSSPHFVVVVGPAATAHGGPSAAAGIDQSMAMGAPLAESGVDTPARLISGGVPPYPPEALAAEIEADVSLDVVVDAMGRVQSVRVVKHVGYGLDDAAERAVRAYRFSPAMLHGHPAAVRMRWPVLFRLR